MIYLVIKWITKLILLKYWAFIVYLLYILRIIRTIVLFSTTSGNVNQKYFKSCWLTIKNEETFKFTNIWKRSLAKTNCCYYLLIAKMYFQILLSFIINCGVEIINIPIKISASIKMPSGKQWSSSYCNYKFSHVAT